MVIRVNRNDNYTVMANYHLRDKELSCKAKGLMSFMLSLPDDWDYSVKGLVSCLMEGKEAVRSMLKELEDRGYLAREQARSTKGNFSGVEYVLHEMPVTENPTTVNPSADNPITDRPIPENPPQINTNITNILNKQSTERNNICPQAGNPTKKRGFTPPTIEEVREYIREKGYSVDAQHFMDYYEAADWHFANGKPVKNWKQCLVTWSRNGYGGKGQQEPQARQQVPYFSKEEKDKEAQRQLEELYKTL